MRGGSPDDKRLGDETLQRIDELAGGWSVPKRARKETEGAASAPDPAASPSPEEVPALEGEAGDPEPGKAERARASKKKPREKTRARGKERTKSSAAGKPSLGDASGEAAARALLGREQPPEANRVPDPDARPADRRTRLFGIFRSSEREVSGRAAEVLAGRAGGEPDDSQAATQVSDRAATRLMSERVATDVSDRAPTRLSDRAPTRIVPDPEESDVSDTAATRIFPDRDLAPTRIFPDGDLAEMARRARDPEPAATSAGEPAAKRSHDETVLELPGSGVYAVGTDASRNVGNTTAILRLPPTLPRRRGVLGDLLYPFTACVGLARTRRELSAADRKLEAEKRARGRRLADLARLALADNNLVSETLARGRDEIMELEDQRSRRAGAAAACDAEIAGLERGLEEEEKRLALELAALQRTDTELREKLEPLQRRLRAAVRHGTRLQESLRDLDRQLARQRNLLPKLPADRVPAAEAHIASLLAERRTLAQEEPVLAAEIDDLEPAIASLIAAQAEVRSGVARIEKEQGEAAVRSAEKIVAAKARRAVDERAEAEMAQAQEDALRALGERLGVDRPPELAARLRGIEEHEVAIATLERRQLELTELLRAVDMWGLARGILYMLAIIALVATGLIWYVGQRAH